MHVNLAIKKAKLWFDYHISLLAEAQEKRILYSLQLHLIHIQRIHGAEKMSHAGGAGSQEHTHNIPVKVVQFSLR